MTGLPLSALPRLLKGKPMPPWSGTQHVAAASATPGIARTRSSAARVICATLSADSKREPDSDVRMTTVFVGSKPGSTFVSAIDVRIINAAPISNMTARRTSTATSTERALRCPKPLPEGPVESLMTAVRFGRELMSAGTRPNTTGVTSETTTANVTMRPSSVTSVPP